MGARDTVHVQVVRVGSNMCIAGKQCYAQGMGVCVVRYVGC